MINSNLAIYLLYVLLFCFNIYANEETDITDEQINKIEALTDDMLMAPDFELNSIDGNKYKLSQLKGNVIILNFWATWCGPCRMEIPDFNELYSKNKDNGLIILGISTDDSKKELTRFLKTYKIKYPILYGSVKQITRISNDYGGIFSLPTSVVIDRKGEIKRIYPFAILKNYTPDIYSAFIYDVETALKIHVVNPDKNNLNSVD